MKRRRRIALVYIGALILFTALIITWRAGSSETERFPVLLEGDIRAAVVASESEPLSYIQWINSADYQSFKETERLETTVLAADYAAASSDADIQRRKDETKQADVIDWSNAKGWVEWEIEVPRDGLYDLRVEYAPLAGSFSQIVRGIQIDGVYPFAEAEHIGLARSWRDAKYPYDRNAIGNEIRPVQEELKDWHSIRMSDYSLSSEPLRWALTKGKHTIRMVGMKEPLSLYALTLTSPEKLPTYKEYESQYTESGEQPSWFQRYEAERFERKSAIRIRTVSVAEPYASPDPKGRLVYNAVGGQYWQNAGESLEWEITVPETGLYAIDLKYFQGYNGKASAYRTIMVDGKVPFREMLHHRFAPNDALEIKTLADPEGRPYLFYLTKGTHQINMTADSSLLRPAVMALSRLNERLTAIERDIRTVTGNYGYGADQNLDQGRVWDMDKYDPELGAKLQSLSDDMKRIRDYLNGLNQAVTDPTTALSVAISQLNELAADVNDIPNRTSVFADIKASINTWTKPIENQPLQLDYLVVRTPQAEPGFKEPNGWNKLQYTAVNFMRTFFQKYDTSEANDKDALTVWVQRGKDYVDLLQLMIEQDFTPATGIKVNVNLMPNQNVLVMGNAAGDQPDLALGVAMEAPVDYAMRGAAEDLSAFPGFDEVVKRFNPGVMRSYAYGGKIYGLPETEAYNMMYYRTDIFERLGIEPPETWEEVMKALPTLQENGMTFMYPRINFLMPYYQHETEVFTQNGLQPQITADGGLAAFKQWTNWFSKYDLPKDVPAFFNHFRFGDMPIGISDITMYIQLTVAAPELAGHWKMVPLPGIERPDGTIARWAPQETTSAVMMKKSERKEQAWKFLEWWTSDSVQGRFGNDIESFAGIEYRWHTANIAALQTIPWTEEDLRMLNEQGEWTKNMPYVPGYYFLLREMEFAWNNTVVGGKPPKEALEKSEMSLLREMKRKQEEFGITPDDSIRVEPYDKPYRRE
ncbi:extracellular solute-binding protein [Paenibacillus spongiae]|uniref:Extracellular solute-binding protein n=1 Tax=Paenibacillus spongiae TaxID=2909671 RepID=A0ABY5S0D2_9BACL|nr:extracellular solute-binding protein [Paenibacillus spongiae]UVI27302.1 extracellular solute-binding protein [Paenibacillus spongiae]